MKLARLFVLFVVLGSVAADSSSRAADDKVLTHPPLRPLPAVGKRPLSPGNARFVDVKTGSDEGSGQENHPWRTINHALKHLQPGDTLYLRAGTYFEQVYLGLQGRKDAPLIIRSYPGEQAIIDGSLQEFEIGGVSLTYTYGIQLTIAATLRWSDFLVGVIQARAARYGVDLTAAALFPSLEIQWNFDPGTFVKAFVGATPGGQICSGGVCREVPAFEGVVLQFVGRL